MQVSNKVYKHHGQLQLCYWLEQTVLQTVQKLISEFEEVTFPDGVAKE